MLIKTSITILFLFFGPFNILSGAQNTTNENLLREIIFWGPSPAESDSLNEEQTEAYSDYYFYIGQASPDLKKMEIELRDTSSFELQISYGSGNIEVFKREKGSVAYIFNDGKQKPKIVRNVMLSEEIISAAKEFFGIRK